MFRSNHSLVGEWLERNRCVIEFLLHYNKRIHSNTKYKPREIVERAQEQDFIKQVKDNTMKSRKFKKDKNKKYIPGLIARIFCLRYLDAKPGYFLLLQGQFQKEVTHKREFFLDKCKILTNKRNYWK